MADITHEALVSRGFANRSWEDEGETFTDYKRRIGEVDIEITGVTLVEIGIRGEWVTVPHCRTLTDLDNLIKLFL